MLSMYSWNYMVDLWLVSWSIICGIWHTYSRSDIRQNFYPQLDCLRSVFVTGRLRFRIHIRTLSAPIPNPRKIRSRTWFHYYSTVSAPFSPLIDKHCEESACRPPDLFSGIYDCWISLILLRIICSEWKNNIMIRWYKKYFYKIRLSLICRNSKSK